jgi:cyclophilin family peptidyl-prolyl cis-trans isomerase
MILLGRTVIALLTASTQDPVAPDSFLVAFETTKGKVVMKAHRAWSPLGVDRLYRLAKMGFYRDAVIYRVGGTKSYPGGLTTSPASTLSDTPFKAWMPP